MNSLHLRSRYSITPSEFTIALRQRVEFLERERLAASSRHDNVSVEHFDKLIKKAGSEWAESLAMDFDDGVRKAG